MSHYYLAEDGYGDLTLWRDNGDDDPTAVETPPRIPERHVGARAVDAAAARGGTRRGGGMRLLDLYCGAGGASVGYHRAGFQVVGVDIAPQPNYPFLFVQADAVEFLTRNYRHFTAVHASPPCQSYSALGALSPDKTYPDLIESTREALRATGLPYVIENVMPAPLDKGTSIVLCGGMFGLRTYRHRRFEPGNGVTLTAPNHPKHTIRTATKQRRQRWAEGWHVSITGDVGTYVGPEAMGIDWMNGNELCEAIPPAYTEHIGGHLLPLLTEQDTAA